jgi:hypothetical protein
MSTLSTVNSITTQTVSYAPAVLAGIQAAEATQAGGASKQAAVVQAVLNGVEVGSGDLAQSSNPTVAGVAALVNLFVSIFNSLGIFKHGTPAA